MLKLQKLSVENFGPFKGRQIIEFPSENGVTIVYGENMRGKTYFLNAIRYSLLGTVRGRGSKDVSLHKIGNWEKAMEGEYGFKVTLNFRFGENDYELTRLCRKKDSIETPTNDRHYIQECFLSRNGTVLGPADLELELSRVMPSQVARFFLFDGELLEEYEELLLDESKTGPEITKAIERILGVPILTNSRADLRELLRKAEMQESKAAQQNQKTQEIGNLLENLTVIRKHHNDEVLRLEGELSGLKNNQRRFEEALRRDQKAASALDEGASLENDVGEKVEMLKGKKDDLKKAMTDAWRGMLSDYIFSLKAELRSNIEKLREDIAEGEQYKKVKTGIDENQCPTCLRPLDDSVKKYFKEYLENNTYEFEDDIENYEKFASNLKALDNIKIKDKRELIFELVKNISDLNVEITTKRDRAKEILESLTDINADEISRYRSDLQATIKEIGIVENAISAEKEKLNTCNDQIDKLQKELEKEAGADLQKESRKRQLYSDLINLFDDAVGEYRDKLRKRVEKDATNLFRDLVHEPDYERLKINESYGLTIIHKDGRDIGVRSAGAEHIVAISLIGALQKNAPFKGPLIMDSTFGRLDEEHTVNVVQALPKMADQVVLLVYLSELKPEIARKELMGKLRTEYRLNRISARHTEIERFME